MDEYDAGPEPGSDNAEVDAALASLETLEGLPVDQHVAVYEEIHASLRASLSRPAGG